MRNGRLLITPAAIVAVLIGAAVMYASIPAPTGVIYGCYSKALGDLRVIDNAMGKCKPNETQLTSNQTGPTGPIGPTGATGPAGPSHAYAVRQVGTTNIPDTLFAQVLDLTVPAGAYIITAKTNLFTVPNGAVEGSCELTYNGLEGDTIHAVAAASADFPHPEAVAVLHDAQVFTTSTAIVLECNSVPPAEAARAVLSAVLVGGIN